jgi:hypothetical protein
MDLVLHRRWFHLGANDVQGIQGYLLTLMSDTPLTDVVVANLKAKLNGLQADIEVAGLIRHARRLERAAGSKNGLLQAIYALRGGPFFFPDDLQQFMEAINAADAAKGDLTSTATNPRSSAADAAPFDALDFYRNFPEGGDHWLARCLEAMCVEYAKRFCQHDPVFNKCAICTMDAASKQPPKDWL